MTAPAADEAQVPQTVGSGTGPWVGVPQSRSVYLGMTVWKVASPVMYQIMYVRAPVAPVAVVCAARAPARR
jgi:hypothetical protein